MNPDVLASAARSVQARQRIKAHIYETPLLPSRQIGAEAGSQLFFKAENFQLTGSFKIRGASAKISAMAPGRHLVTASSGNHGIGSSQAARSFGRDLTVVLPETVAAAKLARIRSYGVETRLFGAETWYSEQHALELARDKGHEYISAYDDPDVVAGQGTIGLELLDQHPAIDNVFIAMGGGGLISGIGSVLKSFLPGARIYGIAARNSCAFAMSMAAGKVVETEHLETLADGVAGGVAEETMTLGLAMSVVDETIICTEEEIVAALRDLAFKENMLVEGSAGLALAGFAKVASACREQVNVVVLCGANYDRDKLTKAVFG
ncbi:pyridoxal-phosphate dependent enzyme [Labrys sp. KB_33_2]|uniref:pyridoxal-phosphate dependent enzyme n=1 Tax=unclassified Labrys (in: a-proteobacteria) TaxID=2688601 RepID=UPI003EB700C9